MSKHTQGKYTIHPTPSLSASGFTIIKQSDGEDTYHIAEVYGSDKEAQNLATLFASAPEMLKMLYEIESVLHTAFLKDEASDIKEVWKKVLRLIYKAEGGAK